jgi:hypothetical protein
MIRACGFEWGTNSELDYCSTTASYGVKPWAPRTGTYAFVCGLSYATGKLFFSPAVETFIQVAFSGSGSIGVGWLYPFLNLQGANGSSTALNIGFDAGMHYQVYFGSTVKGTGTAVYSPGTTTLFEIHLKIDASSGIIETRVDGLTDITFYGNTLYSPSTLDTVTLTYGSNATFYFDDIIVNDTTGSINNSWPDGGQVLLLKPNAIGSSSQWNQVPAGLTHYTSVDEIPPSSADYVSSTTSGALELFGIEDTPGNTGQVLFVSIDSWLQRIPGSTTSLLYTALNYPAGGLYLNPSRTVGTSFSLYHDTFNLNPKTSARWTVVDTNALEVGAKIV